jgi:hypothetical protein
MVIQHEDLLKKQLPSGYQVRPMALEYAGRNNRFIESRHAFVYRVSKILLKRHARRVELPEVNLDSYSYRV